MDRLLSEFEIDTRFTYGEPSSLSCDVCQRFGGGNVQFLQGNRDQSLEKLEQAAKHGCILCSTLRDGIAYCIPNLKELKGGRYRQQNWKGGGLRLYVFFEDCSCQIEFFALLGKRILMIHLSIVSH